MVATGVTVGLVGVTVADALGVGVLDAPDAVVALVVGAGAGLAVAVLVGWGCVYWRLPPAISGATEATVTCVVTGYQLWLSCTVTVYVPAAAPLGMVMLVAPSAPEPLVRTRAQERAGGHGAPVHADRGVRGEIAPRHRIGLAL